MEWASLKAKAAALQERLELEKEKADRHAEKLFRRVQLEAEEKQQKAEFEAQQKRFEAALKARKEMHAMQTALAESDAKMKILQKYDNSREDNSIFQADQDSIAHIKPIAQSQNTFKAASFKHNVPAAHVQMVTSAPEVDQRDQQKPVLDGLCQAIAQQACVTEYLVKNHKASLLPDSQHTNI
ncbi:hypothetical protein AMECASPLE_035968 [Ameca splendens]|uniref:Uncharacterized protein n=1 Tax=Ameca splendens TaxID=208324 RepID=A0ABV0ZHE2_9TELE